MQLFGQQISIETQVEKIVVQKGNAKSIERFAAIALSDDKNIAVLDIKTNADIQIARNRVALRDIAFKLIDQDKYHGLLVFYHSDDDTQLDYRLSFISSQTTIDEDGNFIQQSTNAKRYSFILGANESCTTATLRLLALKGKVPSFKAFETQKGISLKDLTDTFSVEALNNEFFKKYKDIHYKRFWEYIANKPEYAALLLNTEETELTKQQKPIRDFVKKMLGRIVFLHFLQKKGWMGCPADNEVWKGGDKNFMINLFSNYPNQTNFYSNCLTVLFFQTLNTDRRKKKDVAPKELSYKSSNPANQGSDNIRIPFLNGGLFDDELPQTNSFDFPVDYFKDLFDFFSQYNFTIDENSPEEQEVGIDPEMLGHIFENLLEENKDKGAFYTPKEIVHYMCQESLIQYLRTHLPECAEDASQATKAIETFIRKNDIGSRNPSPKERGRGEAFIVANAKRIEAILDRVKICDPAIGSGAFPMGMLQEIFKAKTTLDLTLDKAQVKKDIIRSNIYGVDLENGAVDIARLRFWLSLVVDEEVPQPLPNLDYKIMQGNSLLERFEEIDLSKVHTITRTTTIYEPQRNLYGEIVNPQLKLTDNTVLRDNDLQQLMNDFFIETHPIKKAEKKEKVNQTIHNHIDYNLELWQNALTIQIANAPKLTDPTIKLATKRKIEKLHSDLEALNNTRKALHELENKTAKPYFLWHLLFADVFTDGGFDIVIGNPPYIRQEQIRPIEKKIYQSVFKEVSNGTVDIYVYFIQHGLNILKTNGVLSYITQNKWLKTKYGKELRSEINSKYKADFIIDFFELPVFNEVATDAAITQLRKSKGGVSQTKYYPVKSLSDYYSSSFLSSPQNIRVTDQEWQFLNTSEILIINLIEQNTISLKEYTNDKIYRGLITGLNEAFELEEENVKLLLKSESKSLVKKFAKSTDITKYSLKNHHRYFLVTGYNLDIANEYPTAYEYLKKFEDQLVKREDQGKNWWNLRACKYYNDFEKTKLVYIYTAKNHEFYFDKEGRYINNNCYMIISDSKYLFVYLNSSLFNWYKRKKFVAYGDGDERGRVKLDYNKMVSVPVKPIDKLTDLKFEVIADYLTFLNDTTQPPVNSFTDNASIAPVFEDVANMMVYELYFKQHMQELEIDVLQIIETEKHFKPIDTSENANAATNAKIIGDCYKWLQGQDNPIRNRIILSNSKSPDIIGRINSTTH